MDVLLEAHLQHRVDAHMAGTAHMRQELQAKHNEPRCRTSEEAAVLKGVMNVMAAACDTVMRKPVATSLVGRPCNSITRTPSPNEVQQANCRLHSTCECYTLAKCAHNHSL
jgi:hypothetical protein